MGQFVTATHTTHTSLKMVLKSCLAVALVCGVKAAPQFNGDSSLARILQEQRFNMGDGKFGAAYAQEDGVAFKEESTGNNERIGQYSYIDENGNNIVVKYSAGVNGFRILDGAHIPSGGQTSAQAQITNEAGEPKEYEYEYYDDTQPESPFVNPRPPPRRSNHSDLRQGLPQGSDQARQIPPGIQLSVPVISNHHDRLFLQ